ncbi:hypothetical protein EVAR_9111_1 [Eumeta japonica]|uniref:Uncharacterized protein n=1 Tax=Eumeta variegata TaxID=151549 RepID=A0A4C1TWG6_EUMVA|nr:hypothetical protein EVAR_9111_1 [Eumeta japonica]
MDRHADALTDRQADARQIDRQTDGQIDRQTDGQANGQADEQADGQAYGRKDGQKNRRTDGRTTEGGLCYASQAQESKIRSEFALGFMLYVRCWFFGQRKGLAVGSQRARGRDKEHVSATADDDWSEEHLRASDLKCSVTPRRMSGAAKDHRQRPGINVPNRWLNILPQERNEGLNLTQVKNSTIIASKMIRIWYFLLRRRRLYTSRPSPLPTAAHLI